MQYHTQFYFLHDSVEEGNLVERFVFTKPCTFVQYVLLRVNESQHTAPSVPDTGAAAFTLGILSSLSLTLNPLI